MTLDVLKAAALLLVVAIAQLTILLPARNAGRTVGRVARRAALRPRRHRPAARSRLWSACRILGGARCRHRVSRHTRAHVALADSCRIRRRLVWNSHECALVAGLSRFDRGRRRHRHALRRVGPGDGVPRHIDYIRFKSCPFDAAVSRTQPGFRIPDLPGRTADLPREQAKRARGDRRCELGARSCRATRTWSLRFA